MRNICVVTDTWEPELSGVVNTLQQTFLCLKARGFEIDLIEPSLFRKIQADYLSPGLRFALPPYGMDRLARADAVHIATEGPLGWAAKLFCDHQKIVYSTAYHTNFPKYMKMNWCVPPVATYAYVKKFHEKSASVMVPTKSILTDLEDHDFHNCVLWGRGVNSDIFNVVDENVPITYPGPESYAENWQKVFPRPYFLNVGRLSKEKNIDEFLRLDLPGTKIVVGEGPDKDRLQRSYGGPFSNVLFFGKKTGKELASIYRTADVFVFPSWFDTFGLVNIEAISCGTPVAAFPAPGPVDIIEQGINGYCDHDLETACHEALKIGGFTGEFSWETATTQFIANLQFR